MKKHFFILAAIALLFAGCATKSDVESLQQQINNLMNTQIATTNMQIANIQKSIGDLSDVDKALNGLITGLREDLDGLDGEEDTKYQEVRTALENLENEDAALDQRIKDLKNYCDQQDNGVKSWVTTTFATLEQHSAVLTEMAGIKTRLGELTQMISDLDTSLSQKISDAEGRLNAAIGRSESSVKAWVNEKLADYYTIAQIEAKLKILEDGYKEGDESLSTEISTLRSSLETTKTELTTAYQTAIATAIEQNNGVINAKIAADIKTASDALQSQIDEMKGRLDSVESRLSLLEASVAELIGMVQSIVVVPDYSDGSVILSKVTDNKVRFEIYPLEAAAAIAETGPSILSLDYVETLTKSSEELMNLPITEVSFTGKTLLVTVDGTDLPDTIIEGTKAASARLKISDGTNTRSSEYFPIHKNERRIAITGESDDVDSHSATLYGWSNQEGCASASVVFGIEYSATDLTTAATTVTASEKDAENKYSCRITRLYDNTLYYYRAFTLYNGVRTYGEVKTFKTAVVGEAVDLGLSVKWRSMNLGAEKPEDYGDYYAWGEVEPYYSSQDPLTWKDGKTGYDWATYKWCNGAYNKQTKYCPTDKTSYWDGEGSPDGKTVLDPEDDAAHVNLGGKWRIPTDAEWTELREQCTWEWTSNYKGTTGIAGRIVTSKKTGYTDKSIFLPVAGYRGRTILYRAGSYGYYWSSSLYTDSAYDPSYAWHVYLLYSGNVGRDSFSRYYGQSVRPVSE